MSCSACRDGIVAPFDFTMAFHPIIDIEQRAVWGYEALVRGPNGEGAGEILSKVDEKNRYSFDQSCRVKAIELAAKLFPTEDQPILSINFMPNAVYEPAACIRASLIAADKFGFSPDHLMFEFTEDEKIPDVAHLRKIVTEYKKRNLMTAIDDFGSGFAGLGLLAEFKPDVIKLDMGLIRKIDTDPGRQAIVAGATTMARMLETTVIAEGIETREELETLRELGIELFQGFLFARPTLEALPDIDWPDTSHLTAAVA